MKWVEKNFHDFIIRNKVIGFFKEPIRLKSGRLSHWYINWRNISTDVFLIDKLTDFLISFVNHLKLKPNCFYGVPEGASKLGIITQYKWAKKQENYKSGLFHLSMGRGNPKEHGELKDRYFLGLPKGNVIIIEDVTTTGGSLLDTIKILKDLDATIIAAIGLTDRNERRDDGKRVEEIILKEGIQYYTMSNAVDLLPKLKIDDSIKLKIEEYFNKYGSKELKLP
ncbi:MAG: hypothetical protein ACXABO_08775 [Promethearchaeota archaeon]|jgi:orotate phosphoribosyltransferase